MHKKNLSPTYPVKKKKQQTARQSRRWGFKRCVCEKKQSGSSLVVVGSLESDGRKFILRLFYRTPPDATDGLLLPLVAPFWTVIVTRIPSSQ